EGIDSMVHLNMYHSSWIVDAFCILPFDGHHLLDGRLVLNRSNLSSRFKGKPAKRVENVGYTVVMAFVDDTFDFVVVGYTIGTFDFVVVGYTKEKTGYLRK
ncbi:hypothetical protein Tco_0825614, partial [Tanacetum coccineum]